MTNHLLTGHLNGLIKIKFIFNNRLCNSLLDQNFFVVMAWFFAKLFLLGVFIHFDQTPQSRLLRGFLGTTFALSKQRHFWSSILRNKFRIV